VKIGERIKTLRLDRGLTLEEVAIKLGTTKQTIQRYETGEITNIPSDRIEKLAMVYNTTPVKIMGWEIEACNSKEEQYVSDERKNVMNAIAKLSESDFKYIADLVSRLNK
jgi:transcriptional regulator with XRE-family HTH domain